MAAAVVLHVPFWLWFLTQSDWQTWACFGIVCLTTVGLLRRRRLPDAGPLHGSFAWPLLLNAVLLLIAALTSTPAIAAAGGLIWLYLWLRCWPDRSVESTLHYLTLLPASMLAFAAPQHELQRLGRACGRWLLDHSEQFFLLDADQFLLSSARYSTASIQSGWSSAPVFLVICAGVSVMLRLRLLQVIPLTICALALAVFKGGLAFYFLAYFSSESIFSFAPEAAAAIASLIVSVCLFLSFCSLAVGLSEAIPLDPYQINLIAIGWNRLFLRLPRNEDEQVNVPGWRELLTGQEIRSAAIVQWLREAGFAWSVSRSRLKFIAGIPSLIVMSMLLWLGDADPELLTRKYSKEFDQALQQDRLDDALWLAERMQQLEPQALPVRFELGKRLLAAGRRTDATRLIESITRLDRRGDPAARIWLVEQAQNESPLIELPYELQVRQLQKAIDEDASDILPFVLLARLQEQRQEMHLARAAWTDVVSRDLSWLPELVRLQKRLGSSTERIHRENQTFLQQLDERISEDVRNAKLQAARVRVEFLLEQDESALRHLQAALRLEESAELNLLMASVHLREAIRLANQPLMQTDAIQQAILALQYDPANQLAIDLLGHQLPDGNIDTEPLLDALDYWQAKTDESPQQIASIRNTSRLLMLLDRPERAIELLQKHAVDSTELQWNLVLAFRQAQRLEDAASVVSELESKLAAMAKGEKEDPKAVSRYLELLALQQKHEQVLELISSYRSRTDDALPPPLQTHFVSAVLAQVRPSSEDHPDSISLDEVELLSNAWQFQPERSEILHRLVQATYQQDEAADAAENVVRSAIASGQHLFTIYSVIGGQAIVHDEYERAVDALEKARRFDPNNAVVQNNLALALIRSDMPDGDRALRLIDDALKQAPDFVELIATRAEILIQLQRNVEARQELNRVLQQDPKHQLASKLLHDLDTTETR
ncbi:MAG: hypothetical protein Fues2KO_39760 [Fuerstiella sp.]